MTAPNCNLSPASLQRKVDELDAMRASALACEFRAWRILAGLIGDLERAIASRNPDAAERILVRGEVWVNVAQLAEAELRMDGSAVERLEIQSRDLNRRRVALDAQVHS